MPKERGNLEACLRKTIHHVEPHKVRLMVGAGMFSPETVSGRFQLVKENLEPLLPLVASIRQAAEAGDCATVLALLNRDVEFGHDTK